MSEIPVPPTREENRNDDVSNTSAGGSADNHSSDASSASETVTVEPEVSEAASADAATVDAGLAPPVNSGYISDDVQTAHDRKDDREELQYLGEPKDVEVAYTIATHLDQRRQASPGGVYLDDLERRNAELIRARIEDREPDLENPPAIASTQLVPTVHAQPLAGAVAPVDFVETVNVGVPEDAVADNAAAAEAHGLNPDGSAKDEDE